MVPDDQEQVIQKGVAAKLLLSDPTFQHFFEVTKSDILEAIGNTEPKETAEREILYLRFNALSDLLYTMQSYSDAAEAIQKFRETETDS